jgi:tetratricopeptide (TPR) repeat protein
MFRKLPFAFCAFILAFAAAARPHARAEDAARDEYQHLVQDAASEYNRGNFAEARALFERVHALAPSARTLRGLGLCSFELRTYIRARNELRAALEDQRRPLTSEQREEVKALLERAERYIGLLVVHAVPASATMSLDGAAFSGSGEAEVGAHDLSLKAPGHHSLSVAINVDGTRPQTLELSLTPLELLPQPSAASPPFATPPPDKPEPSSSLFEHWWFWTAVGVVAAGAVTTAVLVSSKNKVEKPLPGDTGVVVGVLRVGP